MREREKGLILYLHNLEIFVVHPTKTFSSVCGHAELLVQYGESSNLMHSVAFSTTPSPLPCVLYFAGLLEIVYCLQFSFAQVYSTNSCCHSGLRY